MSIQPLAFTGISDFSSDFQTILSRAVSIASIPVQSLQSEQAKILARKQLLTNLNGAVASFAERVGQLGEVGNSKALTASSSNTAKVTVNSTSATAPTAYTVSEITSLARSAAGTTGGYANSTTSAVSATGTVKLTFNGTEHTIALTGAENSLTGLRDKINALGAGVTASVLTTGTGATPYYLSIASTTAGLKPIALVDDPGGANTNLLATVDNGANAEFKVNGAAVSRTSNLVNDVVSGVSFTLVGTTGVGETVTITLASDRSKISSALQNLVSAYNALVDQVDAQIGPTAGLLTGDSIIREIQSRMRAFTGYEADVSVSNLAAVGFQLDQSGKASFDSAVFNALTDSQIQASFDLLGSESTGLGAFQAKLEELSDPVTGMIKLQQDRYDETDERIGDQVAVLNERIEAMQLSLSAKLQATDALLAQLESQRTIIDASIQGLTYTLFGRKEQ